MMLLPLARLSILADRSTAAAAIVPSSGTKSWWHMFGGLLLLPRQLEPPKASRGGPPLMAIHRLALNSPVSCPSATDAHQQRALPKPGLPSPLRSADSPRERWYMSSPSS
jgi:hypothetical protein